MQCPAIFLFLIVLTPLAGGAQSVPTGETDDIKTKKHLKIPDGKMAGGEFLATESLPIIFDRYIFNKDYARISFQTIGGHLSPSSWEWDGDGFQTNQIGHPYHGSIFFNTFRSNGYGFYQSMMASFAGSLLWEIAAENQAPAPNDLINTGFGGTVLGETTHRMAERIRLGNSRGMQQQAREIIALLIDPAGGISRLLKGQWGRPVPTTGSADNTPMAVEMDGGLRRYGATGKSLLKNGRLGIYSRIRIDYGAPGIDRTVPFSHISLLVEGGRDDSSRVNIVSVYGSLYGWAVHIGSLHGESSLSANYEYINNQAFYYSAQSVRMNLYQDFRLSDLLHISANIAAGPIVLAAVPDGYTYEGRNYDYGPGLAYNAGAKLWIGDIFSYRFAFRGGWMKTISGNQGHYFLHSFTNEAELTILRHFFVGAEEGYFSLHGNYITLPTVSRVYPYIRLSAKYRLQL